jgi:hypothetical protein
MRAPNEGLLRGNRCVLVHRGWAGQNMRVARARETPALSASLLLFALNRDVHDVPLPIDQQER